MILSSPKKLYVLDQVRQILHSGDIGDYDLEGLSFAQEFILREHGSGTKVCKFTHDHGVLVSILLYKRSYNVGIDKDDELSVVFNELSKLMMEVVYNIDDVKFKKIFPDYNIGYERDIKLGALLGIVTEEEEVVEEEEIVEEIPDNSFLSKLKFW